MTLRHWALPLLLCLAACGETTPEPPPDPDLLVPPETRNKVDVALQHMNNDSATERFREDLVAAGAETPEARGYAMRRSKAALEDSYRKDGQGTDVLRIEGRRRVYEAVGRLGDGPDARGILKLGLEDRLDVRVAAAAGLAAWGDEGALPTLVKATQEAKPGSPEQQAALQGVRRLATPDRRGVILNALGAEGRDVLRPAVLAAFPSTPAERAALLRDVASKHPSPYARAFALESLVEDKDPNVTSLARSALAEGHPALRPVALAALGAAGGDEAAAELAKVLERDPPDADAVARGLYRVGTRAALDAAVGVVSDKERKPATRAAVAREVLGRLREPKAPAAYQTDDARTAALGALRQVVDEKAGVHVVGAVEAIGAVGEPGTDVEGLLVLLRAPDPKVAPTVVKALGRLGGEYAAQKLVELIGNDPGLRDVAATSLGGFARPRDVPVDDVIDLLQHEDVAVRKAALKCLMTMAASNDALGFDPAGSESKRSHGVQQWRNWWAARRNR